MGKTLYLIDGHALIFKMYYAFERNPMYNSKGENTSVIFGFTKYIFELSDSCKPDYLAIAFDPPCKTFRHELFPEYKGTRKETPQLVKDSLEPLCQIAAALKIPVLMNPGFEADDVISSTAIKAAEDGFTVYMVTPDKDYAQIVREGINLYRPGKGGSGAEVLTVKDVCEKYGLREPSQMIDYLTICGDSVDNIEGVRGIGDVGARKLLAQWGSIENIYAHLEEIKGATRTKLEDAKDHIELSKTLVTIRTDTPSDIPWDEMAWDGVFLPEARELFTRYELRSLMKYLGNTKVEVEDMPEDIFSSPASQSTEFREGCLSDLEGIEAVAVQASESGEEVCLASDSYVSLHCTLTEALPLLEDSSVVKVGHCMKRLYHLCPKLSGRLMDLEIIHYLIDPEKSHNLSDILSDTLGYVPEDETDNESLDLFSLESGTVDKQKKLQRESENIMLAYLKMDKSLDEDTRRLYQRIEEPLIGVLAQMEKTGVRVDVSSLETYIEKLRADVAEKEALVRELAGEPTLNISSPKQLGAVLFEKLNIDPSRRAKKNARYAYPTDEETLSALRERHPIVDEILEFRQMKKLLSTYIEPLPSYLRLGRIHTTFNQAQTATGRLSSSNPNLQNIPVRSERGREIRTAFVATHPEGCILSADYSQIELRILAHFCGDSHLTEAFRSGVDIHSATAARIFGIAATEVTSDQRRIAKTANFGILYGISPFGLSSRLKTSVGEARKIIADYFASFPTVRAYIDSQVDFARHNGYVQTLWGRRRHLPEINSMNANIRAFNERNAVNAPIQGTSADIIKIAMVDIAREMASRGMKSRMVLQIHDELLFDVAPGEVEQLRTLVVDKMENAASLSVPLKVECSYGKSWLEAH